MLNKLINNGDNTIGHDTETIAFQKSSAELISAERILGNIITAVEEGVSFDSDVVALSAELSSLVGYGVSITRAKGASFYTYIIPAKGSDITLGDNSDVVKDYEKNSKKRKENNKPEAYIKSTSTIDSILLEGYTILNNNLQCKGVVVDRQNAKIRGLDSGFKQIIMNDFEVAVLDQKLTAREILAVLMHEVGHVFTYIENLVGSYYNAKMALEVIRDAKDDMEVREILIKINNKATDTTDRMDAMSTTDIVVDTGRSLLGLSSRTPKEVEHLADVFSSRFGLGLDLTNAFNKLGLARGSKGLISNIVALMLSTAIIIIRVYAKLITMLFYTSIVLIPIGVLLDYLANWILMEVLWNTDITTMRYSDSGSRYDSSAYDSAYDRYNRVRIQMINSLATSGLSSSDIKIIISGITMVDNTLARIKPSKGLFSALGEAMKSKESKSKDITYGIEGLLSSELLISSARIKISQGRS